MLDDGDRALVGLRGLQAVQLAAEELRREEMAVPGGEPPGQLWVPKTYATRRYS